MFTRVIAGLLFCCGIQQIVAGAHPMLAYFSFAIGALNAFKAVEDMIDDAVARAQDGKDSSIPE